MKIIISGPTGFIGQEVLQQCITRPEVTHIVALSRRRLSVPTQTACAKVKLILVSDFRAYSSEVLEEIKDADAWIWALGKAWLPDKEQAKVVHIDYPLAAARSLTEANCTKPVRFVLLSGGAAERDQSKPLWFADEYRKMRGQAENEVLAYSKQSSGNLQAYVIRPGMVLKTDFNLRDVFRGLAPSVKVDVLAKAMVKVAIEGGTEAIFDNADIVAL